MKIHGPTNNLSLVKGEKGGKHDQDECHELIPTRRFTEKGNREDREHYECDELQQRLELCNRIDPVTKVVGRHRQAVLEKRYPPAGENEQP